MRCEGFRRDPGSAGAFQQGAAMKDSTKTCKH